MRVPIRDIYKMKKKKVENVFRFVAGALLPHFGILTILSFDGSGSHEMKMS